MGGGENSEMGEENGDLRREEEEKEEEDEADKGEVE
jgi:hypothetical protein